MSDKAASAPLTPSEQAEAERLFKTFLANRTDFPIPALRKALSDRDLSHVYPDLLAVIFYAYRDGWDDGYFDGRADAREEADEPDYNEGFL